MTGRLTGGFYYLNKGKIGLVLGQVYNGIGASVWVGFVIWFVVNKNKVRLVCYNYKDHSCNNYKNGGADL